MKLEKMQPGMTLHGVERRRMGNTTMRETVAISYVVDAVEDGAIVALRNGRRVRLPRRKAERLRAVHPKCHECHKVGGHTASCSRSKRRTAEGA